MEYAELLLVYPRLVVSGGPRAGKTTLCWSGLLDRPIVSTDAYGPGNSQQLDVLGLEPLGLAWDSIAGAVIADCRSLGERWVLEGCRAPWCLREGLEADAALWIKGSRLELTSGQAGLAKAARSVWDFWLESAKIPVFEL